MAASKDTDENTTSTPRPRKSPEPPREDLGVGVLRTSRIGSITWKDRQGSSPEDLEGERHEILKNSKKPGDEGYNPRLDPLVTSSALAQIIAVELAGSGGKKSPTWDALKAEEEKLANVFQLRREAEDKMLNRAS